MRYIIETLQDTGIWVCSLPDAEHPALYDTREQAERARIANYVDRWAKERERAGGNPEDVHRMAAQRVRVVRDPGSARRLEKWAEHLRKQLAGQRADEKRINATVETALREMRDDPAWEGYRKRQVLVAEEAKAKRAGTLKRAGYPN